MSKFKTYQFPTGGVVVNDPTKVLKITLDRDSFMDSPDLIQMRMDAEVLLANAMKKGLFTKKRCMQLFKLINTEQFDNIKLGVNIIKAKTDGAI